MKKLIKNTQRVAKASMFFSLAVSSAFANHEAGEERLSLTSEHKESTVQTPACPEENSFYGSAGGQLGLSSYTIDMHINGDVRLDRGEFTGPTLSLQQSMGWKKIINLSLEEEVTLGYANRASNYVTYQKDSSYLLRLDYTPVNKARFFELKAKVNGFVPLLSGTYLKPFIGYAVHIGYVEGRYNNSQSNRTFLRQRFLTHFLGLGISHQVGAFTANCDLSVLIPRGKQKLPLYNAPSYAPLKMSRHGMDCSFEGIYAATKSLSFMFGAKYTVYSVRGPENPEGAHGSHEIGANRTARFNLRAGASYAF